MPERAFIPLCTISASQIAFPCFAATAAARINNNNNNNNFAAHCAQERVSKLD